MPLRSDLPAGLNLSRRATTPVKLPKMSFPMGSGVPEAAPGPDLMAEGTISEQTMGSQQLPQGIEPPAMPRAPQTFQPAQPPTFQQSYAQTPVQPYAQASAQPSAQQQPAGPKVIVYGRAGCDACLEAIQDLIDRQVSFVYVDVGRDAGALDHVRAVTGGELVVPVIVQIGFGGV